jgi:hypothetical protein
MSALLKAATCRRIPKKSLPNLFKDFLYFSDLLMTNVATLLSDRLRHVNNPEDSRQCER